MVPSLRPPFSLIPLPTFNSLGGNSFFISFVILNSFLCVCVCVCVCWGRGKGRQVEIQVRVHSVVYVPVHLIIKTNVVQIFGKSEDPFKYHKL
jgi:hypothetical protein